MGRLPIAAVADAMHAAAAVSWSVRATGIDDRHDRALASLTALRDRTKTPGISAAVGRHGEVVFSGAVGFIDLENRVPATAQSVYDIGSVSKVITAVAVLQLLEEGKLALDDDVRRYVPEFPDHGDRITVRHLLTHTSGIRHYRAGDFPGTPDNDNVSPTLSWRDGLRIFAADPLLFKPGRYYLYSSYAVNLLQGVVEHSSGKDFGVYLRQRVWLRAGMRSAALDDPDAIVAHRARSYRIVDERPLNAYYADLRYKLASGGMMGSAEDLVHFALAINHGGLLTPTMQSMMFTSQLSGVSVFQSNGAAQPLDFEQGLLWRLHRDNAGRRVAYHCGSVRGFNACLVDFIDEDLSAAVLTNSWECCGWKDTEALAGSFR